MSAGYETRDAHVKPLVLFGVGLTLLIVVSSIVSRWLQGRWEAEVREGSRANPMRPFESAPSEPLLQRTTSADLLVYEDRERERLETTGWIDAEAGVVHIPIERAKDLLLERGLPAREEER